MLGEAIVAAVLVADGGFHCGIGSCFDDGIVATMMAQRNRTSVTDRRYEEIGAENWRLGSRGRCTKAEGR
ncbi:MAG: hypothetical protein ACXV4C_10630 [Halobacteriota archaeon]